MHLDFMSWLPFPALRFLPLGLYLRYREPHQPVQHQRNTSATCCTHLHPPEGAPVCGGRDQHQRSKYRPATTATAARWDVPSNTPQQPRHEPLPSFSSSGFILLLVLCSIPAESQKAVTERHVLVFFAVASRHSLRCLDGY